MESSWCLHHSGWPEVPLLLLQEGQEIAVVPISKWGENSSFLPNKPQERGHSALGDPVL